GLGLAFRERLPIAALAPQQLVAQPAEQHVIWRAVLGVLLEALALEPLGVERGLGALLHAHLAGREAKDRQAGVAAPRPQKCPGGALARLGEALARGRGSGRLSQDGTEQPDRQQNNDSLIHDSLSLSPATYTIAGASGRTRHARAAAHRSGGRAQRCRAAR